MALEALANQRRVQIGVGRRLGAKGRAQVLGILLPGVDLGRDLGVRGEPDVQLASIRLRKLVIDVSVQVALAGGRLII